MRLPESPALIYIFLAYLCSGPEYPDALHIHVEVQVATHQLRVPLLNLNHEYSVMQSDGNSWKICTFRKTMTSELMILC